jgi:hypothetical protein
MVAQTASLVRPLRRRADRIDRPARVRIRRRKPCTLWRRRLFGWYVRLLTADLRWCDESCEVKWANRGGAVGAVQSGSDKADDLEGRAADRRHRSTPARLLNGTR